MAMSILRTSTPRTPAHRRATSPPPPILSNKASATDHKFSKHFATIAERRQIANTHAGPSNFQSLLPSASQQVCLSPAPDAMARAFLEADARIAEDQGAVASQHDDESSLLSIDVSQPRKQGPSPLSKNVESPAQNDEDDDVSAVLNNIGDFLDYFDTEAELAKMGGATGKENRKPEVDMLYSGVALMDTGIWD